MENKAKDAAESISRFANSMSLFGKDSEDFVDAIMRDHRTLQQSTFGLFMQCIEAWSKTDRFDARNEYTVKLCKKMMAAIKDDWFGRPPMI